MWGGCTLACADAVEAAIQQAGAESVAAFIFEPVGGSTAGALTAPPGYLERIGEICRRHGIFTIADEVMCGFGRTGKLFAFEHYDVVPDIVCMAKGLTSSYIPLGAMGVSDRIAAHFRENVFWGGLTYNSHALALATAEAVIPLPRPMTSARRGAEWASSGRCPTRSWVA